MLRVMFTRTRLLGRLGLLIPHIFVNNIATIVAIVMAYPGHRMREAVFVAALRHHVEKTVGAHQGLDPASKGRIGVVYGAGGVFSKDAGSGTFIRTKLRPLVVV